MKKLLVLTTVLLLIGGVAGCKETVDPNEPSWFYSGQGFGYDSQRRTGGSEEFMKDYPHVFVAVTGGGSGVGIASLINKTCDVATASREMKPKEIEVAIKHGVTPKEFTVAYDGVAVIVNKDNPIDKTDHRGSAQDFHGQGQKLEGIRGQGPWHRNNFARGKLGHTYVFQGRSCPIRQKGKHGGVFQRDAAVIFVAGDSRRGGGQ